MIGYDPTLESYVKKQKGLGVIGVIRLIFKSVFSVLISVTGALLIINLNF
jgi:hypothetical protein